MATYVVGDIQGCFEPLQRLLAKAGFQRGRDSLWSVGDLVNRGPQSLETLRFLKGLGSSFLGVLGNHDLHFLAVHYKAKTDAKARHLQALLNAPDCKQLAEWVRQLPLTWQQQVATATGPKHVFLVHAGLAPHWTTEKARTLGDEVCADLRKDNPYSLLRGMYGDEPDRWHDGLTGLERQRVITNVLTRLRFCTADGKLNLTEKGEADTAPAGFKPWFEFTKLPANWLLLFGHWATLDGKTNRDDIIGLDTGCVWGRCLTILHLERHEHIAVTCPPKD